MIRVRDISEYQYDVFLSFTGADREIKNQIREYLKNTLGLECYDSDSYCKGQFRPNFCEALDKSRVYLMILSDNLRNDPTIRDGGLFTEVRRESNLAAELEARGDLNIIILCISSFFKFSNGYRNYNDAIGWHFYTLTRGFSRIDGDISSGLLDEAALTRIGLQATEFINARNSGTPILSQKPQLEIATEKIIDNSVFTGREGELEKIDFAFSGGARAVILSGMGGIGKTILAREFVNQCSQKFTLKCPQIVRLKDVDIDENDHLRTLVSAVNYNKLLYDELKGLCEEDRFARKLKALESLPEYILLVIDNYNSITDESLRLIMSRIPARLLITTRVNREELCENNQEVVKLYVDGLDADSAYEMFCRVARSEVDRAGFDEAYRLVRGHTITLSIMAKTMWKHRMSIDKLLVRLTDIDAMSEKIDFSHNDSSRTDTVIGHLSSLYEMGDFDENSRRVLTNMALIADGRIATDTLLSILSLDNRNEINSLIENGWLEEYTLDGVDMLSLHPVLSQVINKRLCPTSETAGAMIEHLLVSLARGGGVSFVDAQSAEDKIFFALMRLAQNEGRLNRRLWHLYVEYSHLMGNIENIEDRYKRLSKYLDAPSDIKLMQSYSDMVVLEQHPTRISVLAKYIENLEENAEDYKWVLRALSLTLQYIIGKEELRPFISSAIYRAISASVRAEDDFAFADFVVIYVTSECRDSRIDSIINKHIRARKKENNRNGYIMYAEYMLCYRVMLGKGSIYKKTRDAMHDLINDDYSEFTKIALRHPINSIRVNLIMSKIQRNEDLDQMTGVLSAMFTSINDLVDKGTIGAHKLFSAIKQLHFMHIKHGTTLQSLDRCTESFLTMISALPENIIRNELRELAVTPVLNMESLSDSDFANLRTALLINRGLRDYSAVKQAQMLLFAERKIHSDEHHAVIAAKLQLATVYSAFGENNNALHVLHELYESLLARDSERDMLSAVAMKLLELREALAPLEFEKITEIYNVSLEAEGRSFFDELINTSDYISAISRLGIEENVIRDITDSLMKNVLNRRGLKIKFGNFHPLLRFFGNIALVLYNNKRFDAADTARDYLSAFMKRVPARFRNEVEIFLKFVDTRRVRMKGELENTFRLARETILLGCKYNRDPNYIVTAAMCDVFHLARRGFESLNSVDAFWRLLFPNVTENIVDAVNSFDRVIMDYINIELAADIERNDKLMRFMKYKYFFSEIDKKLSYYYSNSFDISTTQKKAIKTYEEYALLALSKIFKDFAAVGIRNIKLVNKT